MGAGRPTTYKQEYCQKLIEHMREGLSFETFGAVIGVARDRVYVWAKKHPEFAEAKKEALDLCQLFWEQLGRDGARGGIHNFNMGAWCFNMKNRFGWRDKKDVEVSGDVNTTVNVTFE